MRTSLLYFFDKSMNVTPNKIVAIVSALYGVDSDVLYSAERTMDVCFIRNICYYLIHEICGLIFHDIGDIFGRSKTAVGKGYNSIKSQISVDRNLRKQIEKIICVLKDEILMGCFPS